MGDIIIGLPSNGIHSNGFSLVHSLMKKAGLTLNDKAPFSEDGLTLGESLYTYLKDIFVSKYLHTLSNKS